MGSLPADAAAAYEKFDDDGRPKRTGTLSTASAHIITAVIGSGVLSLPWAVAQLGWIGGTISLLIFSAVTWYTSILLADCYRSPPPDPVTGKRNYSYIDAVKTNLGGLQIQLCGVANYGLLVGSTIGYTLTTAISMAAIRRSDCFHTHGHGTGFHTSNNGYMIIIGVIQIILSQIPNFGKLEILSYIAAVMSFAYSFIGIGLSIARIAGGHEHVKTSLTGIPVERGGVSSEQKMWNSFTALGNIALAYSFSCVLLEIQDTLKSSPQENKVMKKASLIGISISTLFYLICGLVGYAAFGHDAPDNMLTGFGFYEPFWLVDFANICIILHLMGAYQVYSQPTFAFVESWAIEKWPESKFIKREYWVSLPFYGIYSFNFFRGVWRTLYVVFTTALTMLFPFFTDLVGLVGAASFWPVTMYFPVEMYIAQAKIRRFSLTWICLQLLSLFCLIVSLLCAAGLIQGLVKSLQIFKPFNSVS